MKKGIYLNSRVEETSSTYETPKPNRMFSPASFAEMLDVDDFVAEEPEVDVSDATPPVVSFYGLKGGSGRSLCLAYCAVLLARRGLNVGVIDFDFEAPGLHSIFKIENADVGSLAFLEDGNYRNRPLDIWKAIETIPIESKGKVMVMPAGKINEDYLHRLDNLRPLLWNEYDSQPITRLLKGFSTEEFDILLVDCRTGFHGITASMLFHYSDLVVSLFPMSHQIWDGIDIISSVWKNAYRHRNSTPDWLVIPAMVPSGKEGQRLLVEYTEELKRKFEPGAERPDGGDDDSETAPWVVMPGGIPYDPRIATDGHVPFQFSQGGPWSIFEPLVERIVTALPIGTNPYIPISVNYKRILDELDIPAAVGFAEELRPEEITQLLVPSDDLMQAVDPSMGIVVGAKGSGKTLVWRCCLEEGSEWKWIRKDAAYTYLVGHPPKANFDPDNISISRTGFETVERKGEMKGRDSYEQFWVFYGIYRLCHRHPELIEPLGRKMPANRRSKFKRAMMANKPDLSPLLKDEVLLESAEELMLETDRQLASLGGGKIVLCYDGLDTDFQSVGDLQVTRRNNFVKGLLLMISQFRGRLHLIRFKVFLREDIYISIDGLQNRSHMEAYKKELRFQSRDLWRLAMNLINEQSSTFRDEYLLAAAPGLQPPWDVEENKLKSLLEVLWGRVLGKGNKAITTNYITKRISDSQGRLFPRTFVQMLRQAVTHAKRSGSGNDRVLPHQSLTIGVEEASRQRTGDLTDEYVELKPYFSAMQGLKANFTLPEFKEHVSKAFKASDKAPDPKGVNWEKTLRQLETVGVLEKKERRQDISWSVALMYRAGLGVKGAGLN